MLQKYNADTTIKWNDKTGLQHLQSKDKDMYDRIILKKKKKTNNKSSGGLFDNNTSNFFNNN